MGSSSSVMGPQELVEFRKLNTTFENVELPARPESRRLTDRKGFIIYGVAILILLPFLIYCVTKSDFRHIYLNADDCGNFCGYANEEVDGIECSGRDYTALSYWNNGKCVASCPEFSRGYTCYSNEKGRRFNKRASGDYDDVTSDDDDISKKKIDPALAFAESGRQGWKFLLTIFITIGLGIVTLVLLRYTPAPVVWGIVIFSMLVLVLTTIGVWALYFTFSTDDYSRVGRDASGAILFFAIFWTIIAIIVLIVFLVLFKKIGLVIQLFKEATKVLAAMPMVVFVPIFFAVIEIIILVLGLLTTVLILSSRQLVYKNDGSYVYELSGLAAFTAIYNVVIFIWSMKLVAGVQYMIISGSASTWYFAKNKDYLDSPICTNFKITFKYHLGTIAFGSFLLTMFSMVKALLKLCCRNPCCRCLVFMCCDNMEIILRFLSENSYIQTGIHGQSFIRSAKRATKLLMANIRSVLAINCVGDFVLGLIIFFVSIIATAISYALFSDMSSELRIFPTVTCFVINIILISIVFASFSTIIDTLFMCFCEDSVLNDGMARPYYMSRGLMEFVENSKKIYDQNNR